MGKKEGGVVASLDRTYCKDGTLLKSCFAQTSSNRLLENNWIEYGGEFDIKK